MCKGIGDVWRVASCIGGLSWPRGWSVHVSYRAHYPVTLAIGNAVVKYRPTRMAASPRPPRGRLVTSHDFLGPATGARTRAVIAKRATEAGAERYTRPACASQAHEPYFDEHGAPLHLGRRARPAQSGTLAEGRGSRGPAADLPLAGSPATLEGRMASTSMASTNMGNESKTCNGTRRCRQVVQLQL